MSRENTYTSVILKKQPLGEGDELVTIFTKEAGKLRALAKSVKLTKSKLQYGLQVPFLVKLRMTRSGLPKIIGVEIVDSFSRVREDLKCAKNAFYALELVLKFTADEHKNEKLFNLLLEFLSFINKGHDNAAAFPLGLAKFKVDFLTSVGLSIHDDLPQDEPKYISFSNGRGGFLFGQSAQDAKRIKTGVFQLFLDLKKASFQELPENGGNIRELQEILSSFLEYHLERDVKSEKFLES